MILGLTGKNAAGKGEVANYLKSKGFAYCSLSDELREEATKGSIGHSRESLINLGNELRGKYGPNYLARKINNKINQAKKLRSERNFFVVDSIRSPFEVEELRKNRDFILVGVDAPIELRFERLLKRDRLGDAKTLVDFKLQEEMENLKDDTNQQLDKCLEMADKIIVNDGELEDIHKKIDRLLEELKQQNSTHL